MKPNVIQHIVLPLLAALIWGTAFVSQSICARHMPPFAVNALRSAIAVAALLPICRAFDTVKRRRGETPGTDFRMLLRGSLVCGLFLAAGANLQQTGLADTAAGKAGFITAFYIVLVPVFGIFLHKRTGWRIWFAVTLVSVGLWLLCVPAGERFTLLPSDALLILCAVCYAFQVLGVDRFAQKLDGVRLSIGQFAVTFVVSAVLSLLFEREQWTAEGLRSCVGPLLYMGVVSSGIAYTLQILAQRGGNPTLVTLLLGMESVFSVLAGAVILGDRLTGREYAGCALMFAAVVLAQIPLEGARKAQRKP